MPKVLSLWIFRDILPTLREFLRERSPSSGLKLLHFNVPKFLFGATTSSEEPPTPSGDPFSAVLVLEDLASKGYQIREPTTLLLDHDAMKVKQNVLCCFFFSLKMLAVGLCFNLECILRST